MVPSDRPPTHHEVVTSLCAFSLAALAAVKIGDPITSIRFFLYVLIGPLDTLTGSSLLFCRTILHLIKYSGRAVFGPHVVLA